MGRRCDALGKFRDRKIWRELNSTFFFTHRIGLVAFRRVIGIVDTISHIVTRDAPLPNGTSETTGDYRYHSHHNQRNETDAHINGVRSSRRLLRCLMSRADKGRLDLRHAAVGVPGGRIGSRRSPGRARGIPGPKINPDTNAGRWGCPSDVLSETFSARSRSIRRDVAFLAGGTDPSARSWEHRPPLGVSGLRGDAEGRTSGDAMWRWRWVATLLYTSVCTRGWHHAGAATSPARVRNGRRRTRGPRPRAFARGSSSPLSRFRRVRTAEFAGRTARGEFRFCLSQ